MSSDNDSTSDNESEALARGLALFDYAWPDLTLSKIMKAKPKVTDHDYFEATVGLIEECRSINNSDQQLTNNELSKWLEHITRKDAINGNSKAVQTDPIVAVPNKSEGSFTVRPRGVHSAHFDNS